MKFLVQAIAFGISARVAQSVLMELRTLANPALFEYVGDVSQKLAKELVVKFFCGLLSIGGFLIFFVEAMRQIDITGGIYINALLIGGLVLCLGSMVAFFIAARWRKESPVLQLLKEKIPPAKHPELEVVPHTGLDVILLELKQERERFICR